MQKKLQLQLKDDQKLSLEDKLDKSQLLTDQHNHDESEHEENHEHEQGEHHHHGRITIRLVRSKA